MIIMKTHSLSKGYFEKKALENVNLEFELGKVYALLGPNGSGKSTFMKIAAGILKPTFGEISVDGEKIGIKSKELVSYMPTEKYLYKWMKIKQVKEFFVDFYKNFNSKKFDEILKEMELDEEMKVSSLSTGMYNRLKIALSLSRDAKIYMFDEPLTGIDMISREKIIQSIIHSIDESRTFIIAEHFLQEIEKIFDEAIFISGGKVILKQEVEKIRFEKGKSLSEYYKEVFGQC